MTDIDMTGWTPHDGKSFPPALFLSTMVIPLFRGTPETGPHEGGAAAAGLLDWFNAVAEPNFTPSPMDVLTGHAPKLPRADIIAFCLPENIDQAKRYPHVRADLVQ